MLTHRRNNPPSPRKGAGFRLTEHGGRFIPALSLTQPWVDCILDLGKPVENRTWKTDYRGPLWLHAAKTMKLADYDGASALANAIRPSIVLADPRFIIRSAFVGLTWVVGCEANTRETGPWTFLGQYGWHLDLSRTWRLSGSLPASGALGLWRTTEDEDAKLRALLPEDARRALYAWRPEQC